MQSVIVATYGDMTLDQAERELRRELAVEALVREKGRSNKAAERLGIHRNTYYRILQEAGLPAVRELVADLRRDGRLPQANRLMLSPNVRREVRA